MKTVLEMYCEFAGWQGGTIHQAEKDFVRRTQNEKDKFASDLSMNCRQIKDIEHARFFMINRMR